MKILNLFLALFLLQLSFVGCSSDDNGDTTSEEMLNEDQIIVGFKDSYSGVPVDPNSSPVYFFNTGIIVNNRIKTVTGGDSILQDYTYNAANKVVKYQRVSVGQTHINDFFYDSQNRLVGINFSIDGVNERYYRILHPSQNTAYLETIDLPYNDPNAELGVRRILEFDENDNIISAGVDINLDGIIDVANNFQYDAENNLIAGQNANGETISIAYSSIINTETYLYDKTFGKRMFRIWEGETYASNDALHLLKSNEVSSNISLEESQSNIYETLDNNFFFKRTIVDRGNPNLTQTFILEYTFE